MQRASIRAALVAAAIAASRRSTACATKLARAPRAGLVLAVAAGTATAAAAATSTVVLADAPPLQAGGGSQWDMLVAEVRGADAFAAMRAVETLVAVAVDTDNHDALVRAGAVAALVAAYRPGDGNAAWNVAMLRALADLSRKDGAHAAFEKAGAPEMLAAVLRECGVPSVPLAAGGNDVGAWLAWAGSWVGIGSGVPAAITVLSPRPPASSSTTQQPLPDGGRSLPPSRNGLSNEKLLLPIQSSPALAVGSVDIIVGMIYHATRCIANLARNSNTHSALMSSDLLDSMINLVNAAPLHQLSTASSLTEAVGDEQRADTLRFAALSVAALSKTEASAVIAKRGHVALIGLLAQNTDIVAQTYAAGGIRNLTRHVESDLDSSWQIHRDLVVDGVVPALCTALATASSPQTQVFSALAVGDILSTGYFKADIICKRMMPTFAPFGAVLGSGNVSVARAAHRALDQVYLSGADEHNGMLLSTEAAKRLAPLSAVLADNIGPLVRGPATKGDGAAIGAIASLCLDDVVSEALVEKGVVPVIINILSLKNECSQQAAVALARLSARAEHMSEIVLRGGTKAAMRRKDCAEDARWEVAALANMARADRNRPDIAHGGLALIVRAAHSKHPKTRREGARGLFNLTIGGVSRVLTAQGGALLPLMHVANGSDAVARRYAVGAIAAISELFGFGSKIVELDGIAVMLRAAIADKTLDRDTARCFAQLSNHVESHEALAKEGAVEWLVKIVNRGDAAADTLHHAAAALCNIAYTSGAPHEALRKASAAAALTGLASGMYPPAVAQCARLALSNLRGGTPPVLQHADSHGLVDPV
jgi:hypothetical protein